MKEFIASAANMYFLPQQNGPDDGDHVDYVLTPMAELILIAIEVRYQLDDKAQIAKTHDLESVRIHISLDNLEKYIERLQEAHASLKELAITCEQQRAGVDPGQASLPL